MAVGQLREEEEEEAWPKVESQTVHEEVQWLITWMHTYRCIFFPFFLILVYTTIAGLVSKSNEKTLDRENTHNTHLNTEKRSYVFLY